MAEVLTDATTLVRELRRSVTVSHGWVEMLLEDELDHELVLHSLGHVRAGLEALAARLTELEAALAAGSEPGPETGSGVAPPLGVPHPRLGA